MFKLQILQKDNSIVGTDMYRSTDASIANAFRPTLSHAINPNSLGTNNQVTIKSVVPVVVNNEGVASSTNQYFCSLKFSSLQHITNDAERELAFDNLIEYATKAKAWILSGTLPDEPIVFGTV